MKRLKAYLSKLFGVSSPPSDHQFERREAWRLTLEDWRKQDQLVLESKALARNLTYRAQIDVLRNSHPVHTVFSPLGVSPTDRVVHQAKCEGFELALNSLDAMTKSLKRHAQLEATFEPPEEQTNKRK